MVNASVLDDLGSGFKRSCAPEFFFLISPNRQNFAKSSESSSLNSETFFCRWIFAEIFLLGISKLWYSSFALSYLAVIRWWFMSVQLPVGDPVCTTIRARETMRVANRKAASVRSMPYYAPRKCLFRFKNTSCWEVAYLKSLCVRMPFQTSNYRCCTTSPTANSLRMCVSITIQPRTSAGTGISSYCNKWACAFLCYYSAVWHSFEIDAVFACMFTETCWLH